MPDTATPTRELLTGEFMKKLDRLDITSRKMLCGKPRAILDDRVNVSVGDIHDTLPVEATTPAMTGV